MINPDAKPEDWEGVTVPGESHILVGIEDDGWLAFWVREKFDGGNDITVLLTVDEAVRLAGRITAVVTQLDDRKGA